MANMASRIARRYFRELNITFVGVAIQSARCVQIGFTVPDVIIDNIEQGTALCTRKRGELYARLRRNYKATFVCPLIHPIMVLDTPYQRIADIPEHKEMKSRGLELVALDALLSHGYHAIHTGDDIAKPDIQCDELGNIEIKYGGSAITNFYNT